MGARIAQTRVTKLGLDGLQVSRVEVGSERRCIRVGEAL